MGTKQLTPRKAIDGDLRDVFAAHALTGICANATVYGGEDAAAKLAYLLADAMLAEKAKTATPEPEPLD